MINWVLLSRPIIMKRYIPPRERGAWKNLRVSTVGLSISILMTLTIISLISAIQSYWYTEPVAAQETQEPKVAIISDAVVGSKNVSLNTNQNVRRISNPTIDLSTLPLERNWPVRGRLTTYFSSAHPAIDIAVSRGTPIKAFASGVVLEAGYSGSFGRRIILQHNNGFQTLYAHLDSINVGIGQSVYPGTIIGGVGSTGRATGPHLHFQVTQNARFLNPLSVLP